MDFNHRACRIHSQIGKVLRFAAAWLTAEDAVAVPLVPGVQVRRHRSEVARPHNERADTRRASAEQVAFVSGWQTQIEAQGHALVRGPPDCLFQPNGHVACSSRVAERRVSSARADLVLDRAKEVRLGIRRAEASNRRVRVHDEIGGDNGQRDGHVEPIGDAVADEHRRSTDFCLNRVDRRDDVFAAAEQLCVVMREDRRDVVQVDTFDRVE